MRNPGLGWLIPVVLWLLWGASVLASGLVQVPQDLISSSSRPNACDSRGPSRTIQKINLLSDGPLIGVAPGDLVRLLDVREGEPYSPSAVKASIQRLHSTDLFHDIQFSCQSATQSQVDLEIVLIRRYLVGSVRFRGELRLDESELRQSSTTRVGEPFHDRRVEDTVARLKSLYLYNGYYEAQVQPSLMVDREKAVVAVEFFVDSGEAAWVSSLAFDVEGDLDISELPQLKTTLNGQYSERQKDDDLVVLETYLRRQGYLNPQVYLRGGAQYDPENNHVSLVLRIVPGHGTEIRFEGDEVGDDILAETTLFSEGVNSAVFLEDTVDLIEERLQLLGFSYADVQVVRTPESGPAESIVFSVNRGERVSVSKIEFVGNEFLTAKDLAQVIRVRKKGLFRRGRQTEKLVNEDLQSIENLYRIYGFLDVEADWYIAKDSEGKIRVVFEIFEGERYFVETVEMTGNRVFPIEELMSEVQAVPGEPFSSLMPANDRSAVTAFYEDRGYREVDFSSQISFLPSHRVAISYVITEGEQSMVDRLLISGNLVTRDKTLRRQIRLREGEPFSLDSTLSTETNLYNLAVFNRVQIKDTPSFSDPLKRSVMIKLEEAKRYTVLYGLGYSTFEGIRGTFGVTNSNFRGQARPLSLNLRASKQRQRGSLTYALPRFYDSRFPTLLSFAVSNELARTEGTSGINGALQGKPYDAFRLIAASQSEKTLSSRESLFFRYSYEQTRQRFPEGLQPEFFREEDRVRLSSVTLSYLNESRTDPANPRGGFLVSGDIKVSSRYIGSGAELVRLFGQGQYYKEIQPGVVWVASLRTGMVLPYGRTSEVPISELYFSGGATTLRGLPQELAGPLLREKDEETGEETGEVILVDKDGFRDPDGRPVPKGGELLLLANTEVRFPIAGILRGAVFYDLGNVFKKVSAVSRSRFENAVGMGFHVRTPVGPVRFDVGYNPSPLDVRGFNHWNFYLTLGHPF